HPDADSRRAPEGRAGAARPLADYPDPGHLLTRPARRSQAGRPEHRQGVPKARLTPTNATAEGRWKDWLHNGCTSRMKGTEKEKPLWRISCRQRGLRQCPL